MLPQRFTAWFRCLLPLLISQSTIPIKKTLNRKPIHFRVYINLQIFILAVLRICASGAHASTHLPGNTGLRQPVLGSIMRQKANRHINLAMHVTPVIRAVVQRAYICFS
jgi:hypothetical protein